MFSSHWRRGVAGLIALVAVPVRMRVRQPSEVPVLAPEAVTPRL